MRIRASAPLPATRWSPARAWPRCRYDDSPTTAAASRSTTASAGHPPHGRSNHQVAAAATTISVERPQQLADPGPSVCPRPVCDEPVGQRSGVVEHRLADTDRDLARAGREHLGDTVLDTGGEGRELCATDQAHQHRLGHLDAADLGLLDRDRASGDQTGGQVERAVLAHEPEVPPLHDVSDDRARRPRSRDRTTTSTTATATRANCVTHSHSEVAVPSSQIGRLSPNWESTPTAPAAAPAGQAEGCEAQPRPVDPGEQDGRGGREHVDRTRGLVRPGRRLGRTRGGAGASYERLGVGGRQRVEGDAVVVDAGADLHLLEAEDTVSSEASRSTLRTRSSGAVDVVLLSSPRRTWIWVSVRR